MLRGRRGEYAVEAKAAGGDSRRKMCSPVSDTAERLRGKRNETWLLDLAR